MPRIALTLPDHLPFTTEMRIRITDLNYGRHLGNDALLSLVHEARVRYFASLGYTEPNLGGVGTMMTDCAIRYLSEGIYGQRLTIRVGAADLQSRGFDVYYEITDTETGRPVAHAKTGVVAFDYEARKVRPLPEAVAKALDPSGGNQEPRSR